MTTFRHAVGAPGRRFTKRVAAGAFVLGGLLGACSADDDTLAAEEDRPTTTTTAPVRLTADEFVEQTNAICHTAEGRRQGAAEQLFVDWPATTADQRATFVRISGDIAEGSHDAFAALVPPEHSKTWSISSGPRVKPPSPSSPTILSSC